MIRLLFLKFAALVACLTHTSRPPLASAAVLTDTHKQVNPLTGRGPAWANSLFEDNAQFGLGISMGLKQRRASYAAAVKSLLGDLEGPGSPELRNALQEWLQVRGAFAAAAACLPGTCFVVLACWLPRQAGGKMNFS